MTKTPETPDLLLCPFCGSSAESMWLGGMFSIECDNNNCTVKPNVMEFDEEQAITSWNTRAAPLPDDKAVDDVFDDEYLKEAYDMAMVGMKNSSVFDVEDYDIINALTNGTNAWLNRAALQRPDESELIKTA